MSHSFSFFLGTTNHRHHAKYIYFQSPTETSGLYIIPVQFIRKRSLMPPMQAYIIMTGKTGK